MGQHLSDQEARMPEDHTQLEAALQLSKGFEKLLLRAQEEIVSHDTQLAQVHEKLRIVEDRANQLTKELALKEAQLSSASSEIKRISELFRNTHRHNAQLNSEINDRFSEIGVLTKLLRDYDESIELGDWACRVLICMTQRPWWWSFLPRALRRQREFAKLQRLRLFDADAYLTLYPDVKKSGLNPLYHFVLHGRNEGRTLVR